jgi:hypothetical protein
MKNMTVTDIEDRKPHLTIQCKDAIHVLPVSTLYDVIEGKLKFTDIDRHEDLIKPILKEYLDSLGW